MAFRTSYNAALGMPSFSLAGVDTVQRVAIGTVLRGWDDSDREAEFIYLPGTAGSLAGDAVTYDLDPTAPVVTRAANANAINTGAPVAVALTAVPAGSFGWYQISGLGVVNAAAGTAKGRSFTTATPGVLSSTPTAGGQIIGMRTSTPVGTPAAGQAYVTLNRPSMQSQIT